MDINVNIRAANAEDYKAAIKALMDGAGLMSFDLPEIEPVDTKTKQATEAAQMLRTRLQPEAAPAPQAAPVQAPVPNTEELPISAHEAPQQPAVAETWAPGGSTPTEATAKPVTLDELQVAGRKVAMAGHQDRLMKVLKKYGVTNLSGIPDESRADALADLEATDA